MSKKPGSAAGAPAAAAASAPFDEKKLRPIHEAIDSGNYKHGVKLLHAAMAKAGKKPVLQSLLALCHAYTHQPEEARLVLDTLPKHDEMDQITLNTVTLVYQAMDDVPSLISVYEASLARQPKDEETMLRLFFAVIRTHDYGKLQTTGMKLFTSTKKDKYLVWSGLNLLLLRRDTPAQAPGADKMLQLLEMMLQRTFGYPTFPRTLQPEELLVLLRVYTRQLKYADAIKLLESESGLAFKEKDGIEYLRIKAQILRDMATAQTDEAQRVRILLDANAVYHELVEQNNDDWFFLTQYIEGEVDAAGKPLAAAPTAEADAAAVPVVSFDERIARLRTFLLELQQKNTVPASSAKAASQALKRGPFLADVELEFQLWQRLTAAAAAPASIDTVSIEKSLISYFRQFGSKSCFFYDVTKYLEVIAAPSRVRLAHACMGLVPSIVDAVPSASASESDKPADGADSSNSDAAQVKRFQLNLSIQQLMRYNYSAAADAPTVGSASSSSGALSSADLESSGKSMFDQYLGTTRLASSLLRIQSERGVGDHYLILFAHQYFSLFLATKQRRYLLDVIMALELALTKYSQFNYQFKLWLIRLYVHPEIGAFNRAHQIYTSLDIKQIQYDTTSHLLMEDAVRYGHVVSDSLSLGAKLIQWHAAADREDVSTTQFGYERGNYSKIIEFVDFRERREVSLALYQARVMKAYGGVLALGTQAASTPADKSSSAATTDSKDLANLHAFLLKSRADLASKHPTITDHSTNDSMAHLAPNNDFTILTVWDVKTSPLDTMLNRPAPSLLTSSFALPNGELLRPKQDDTHTHFPSASQLQSLRFYRLALDALWHMMEQRSSDLRTSLGHFKSLLTDMHLVDFQVELPANPQESLASFDDRHWRLCFLALENSACVLECGVLNASYLDGLGNGTIAEEEDKLEQHCMRWGNVQRQFGILGFLVDTITEDISARFNQPLSGASAVVHEDTAKVVHGLAKDTETRAVNPSALRDAATYAQFAATWLATCVQMWSTVVPSKKTFKKLSKKRGGGSAPEMTLEEETTILEPVLAVRLALASLIKSLRTSIASLSALGKKAAARVTPPKTASSSPATAPSASSAAPTLPASSFLEHKSTILALQAPENAAVVQAVLQHIDASHAQAAANLVQLLHSIDLPLQQIKL